MVRARRGSRDQHNASMYSVVSGVSVRSAASGQSSTSATGVQKKKGGRGKRNHANNLGTINECADTQSSPAINHDVNAGNTESPRIPTPPRRPGPSFHLSQLNFQDVPPTPRTPPGLARMYCEQRQPRLADTTAELRYAAVPQHECGSGGMRPDGARPTVIVEGGGAVVVVVRVTGDLTWMVLQQL